MEPSTVAQLRAVPGADVAHDERMELWERVAHLPLERRRAIFLRYFCDLRHADTAVATDAPAGTVEGRVGLRLVRRRGD